MRFLSALQRGLAVVLAAIVVASLSAMSLLTTVDAGGRYLLNRPVVGSVELTELLMVALIFAAIPLVSLSRGHVVVDVFSALLPRPTRWLQRAFSHFLACGISALLAAVTWQKAVSVAGYGDLTPMINIPLAPFVYAMSVLLIVNALVHLAQLFGFETAQPLNTSDSATRSIVQDSPDTLTSEARHD